MVHKLLALYYHSQTQWTQRYPTTRHIPEVNTNTTEYKHSVFNILRHCFATKVCTVQAQVWIIYDKKSKCFWIISQQLLHDISLVVGRLRLLGEEIHRLKKWGGLKLRILKITCTDTRYVTPFTSFYSCTFPWHVEPCCLCGWHRFKFLHCLNLLKTTEACVNLKFLMQTCF